MIECGKVYYQPKIELSTLQVSGVEALYRTANTDTETYIRRKEEDGSVEALDLYVFETVCKDFQRMRRVGDIPVAVNLSRKTLLRKDIAQVLCCIAEKYRTPTQCIECEITETFYQINAEEVAESVASLRKSGFKIAIDDFGKSGSCLGFIGALEFDTVKIDACFLRSLDDRGTLVLEWILGLVKALGKKSVVEGVETSGQTSILRHLGCEQVQGFYFAKPMPIAKYLRFIREKLRQSTRRRVEWKRRGQ